MEETPGQIIGRNVRDLRKAGMFTRHELAERSGLSMAGIIKVEQGRSARPRRTTIERIARGLGVPVERLLAGTEGEAPKVPLGEVVSERRLEEVQREQERLNAALDAGEITITFYSRRLADLYAAMLNEAEVNEAERASREAG